MDEEKKNDKQDIEFVDQVPIKGKKGGKWANQLLPLLKKPGQWALIWTCENPQQALSAQSNLHQRAVIIPEPNHVWEFASRGCDVYAVYRGEKRGSDAGLRRANRRG